MLEGYLRKWVGLMYGWKPRYFILHNGLLTFCDKKGGKRKGTIFLKIATISTIVEDPLRIVIHTGTHEIQLRAETIPEMQKWYTSLTKAQEESIDKDFDTAYPEKHIETVKRTLSPESKSMIKDVSLDNLKEKLAQIWVCQAEFDETLSHLTPQVKSIPHLHSNMKKLEEIGAELKVF